MTFFFPDMSVVYSDTDIFAVNDIFFVKMSLAFSNSGIFVYRRKFHVFSDNDICTALLFVQ